MAVMRQYEVGLELRKLEASGHDLSNLDDDTLNSLPLQVHPEIRLAIDFEKRLIDDPTGKIDRLEPLRF